MAGFRPSFASCLYLAAALGAALPAAAGEADVVGVVVHREGPGTYAFDVTVRHADTGWDHYADAWEVVLPDGKTVLATRTLLHPHETEQPFTRSERIRIPAGVTRVQVRAGDNVAGMGGNTVVVDLTRAQGERYRVR